MAMDMPTTDTMDTHMLTTDTTMARDPLMLMLMLMLTTDTTHMLMLDTVMDTMLMATMDMPTTDTMDTHMLMVTMDIINLLYLLKNGGVCYVKWVAPSHNCY